MQTISVEDIPAELATYLDITTGAAQMLLSITVILAVLLPTLYLARGTRGLTVELVMLFLTECLLVALTWLPFWVLIATVAVLALSISAFGTNAITGSG